MRLQVIRPWFGLAAVVFCACSPAPRPAAHVITAPSVLQPLPAPPATPELSALPDPSGLVAVARLRNPEATFKAATQLAKMPELSLTALLSLLGAADRAGLFRLDASVDLAMLVDPDSPKDDPKFLAAISVPLRNLEESRAALATTFSPIAPGVYRGTLEPPLKERGRPSNCDLSAAAGDAPARLVCAETERELDSLRPWMTRTLARTQPPPVDLRFELRARPFQQSHETEIAMGIDELSQSAARFLERELKVQEPELLEAPGVVLRETAAFFNDIDTLRLDASLDAPAETVSMRGTLSFRTTHGWYTRLLTHRNDRTGPPPALFWRLPKDCETAVHARGADPSYYEGIYRVLRLAANRLLTPNGVSERSRAAVDEFLGAMPSPDVASASASGTLSPTTPASVRTAADSVKAFKSLAGSLTGWTVTGMEAPSGPYVAWLRKGGNAIDLLLQDLRKQLPAKDRVWVPTAKFNAAPAGLPRGSAALDLTWNFDSKAIWSLTAEAGVDHPAGAVARGQLAFRIAIVPDGPGRTWFGFSADNAVLQKRIAAALAGAPEAGTIASRQDIAPLRREPSLYSGFITYGSAVDRSFGLTKRWGGSGEADWLRSAITAAPNKLQTPILLLGTGTTGPAPSSSLELRFQRGSIEDLAALVRYMLTHAPPPTRAPYP